MRRRALLVATLTALVTIVVPAATQLSGTSVAAAPQNPGTVRDWNAHALAALVNPATAAVPGAGLAPTVTAINMAMVQGAVYDAVNSIDRGHQPYLAGLPLASPTASLEAAVATAAHHVLLGIGGGAVPPLPQVVRDRLDALYAAELLGITDGPAKGQGIAAGEAAACSHVEGEGERRPLRVVQVLGRRGSRRVASNLRRAASDALRQRSERLGGTGHAIHPGEPFTVPDQRSTQAHRQRLRQGVQRGQVPRSGELAA